MNSHFTTWSLVALAVVFLALLNQLALLAVVAPLSIVVSLVVGRIAGAETEQRKI